MLYRSGHYLNRRRPISGVCNNPVLARCFVDGIRRGRGPCELGVLQIRTARHALEGWAIKALGGVGIVVMVVVITGCGLLQCSRALMIDPFLGSTDEGNHCLGLRTWLAPPARESPKPATIPIPTVFALEF